MSKIFPSLVLLAMLTGCASTGHEMTPLEIQSMQTRFFDQPKEVVFASVVSVFQDLGYQIQSADVATGLITSESPADSTGGWYQAFTGNTRVTQTRATAFVEQIGSQSQARLNFLVVNETSSGWGQRDRQDRPIIDADIYQNAFERIENAVFIRAAN